MTLMKIDYIPPTGIEEYDQQVINHFNKLAKTINDMNFTTDREEAGQAGATDYLEALDSLENNWHEVIKARDRLIEYGEIIKKRQSNDNTTNTTNMTQMTPNMTQMTRQQ